MSQWTIRPLLSRAREDLWNATCARSTPALAVHNWMVSVKTARTFGLVLIVLGVVWLALGSVAFASRRPWYTYLPTLAAGVSLLGSGINFRVLYRQRERPGILGAPPGAGDCRLFCWAREGE